jgi:hypothetical protein
MEQYHTKKQTTSPVESNPVGLMTSADLGQRRKRINLTIHARKEKRGSTMGLFGKAPALAPSVEGLF